MPATSSTTKQGTPTERRGWFGRTIRYTEQGERRRYEFAWLPADEAQRPLATGDVSLFDSGLASPTETLLGRMPFDPELSESGRTPILMCQCGDPYCGALMARIIVTDQSVSWTDWSWDHFYAPSRPAINIPDFNFDLTQYTDELLGAEERSAGQRPISVVEVRETYSFSRLPVSTAGEQRAPESAQAPDRAGRSSR